MNNPEETWRADAAERRCAELQEEVRRLSEWKESAMTLLSRWDAVWEAAGKPGKLGACKAEAMLEFVLAEGRQRVGSIFELVDATDDETYFTLGLYLTLQGAIDDATHGDHPPTDCHDDFATIEIRERKIGFGGFSNNGKKVGSARWRNVYSEEADQSAWEVEYESNTKLADSESSVDRRFGVDGVGE